MMHRILSRCALALSLGLLTSCSSFDRQWKSAAQGTGGATRWDGSWTSGKHHKSDGSPEGGRLRCVLEPLPAQKLAAHFHANWLMFSSNFDMTLEPVPRGPHGDKTRHYRGTHQLPAIFGGAYRYEAGIVDDHFTARYTSSYDHGVFALRRVPRVMEHFQMHPEH